MTEITINKHSISWVTFLLAWVAGFCDTVTFIKGDNIFSAHVTGNFIVFAAQIVSGSSEDSWIKLLTFPVFILAVIIGGWIADKAQNHYKILLTESILLIMGGLLAKFLPGLLGEGSTFCIYFVVMFTVFAVGLQNTFGRLFAKETFGPTTIMTGNVTQASLDLGSVLRKGIAGNEASWQSLKKLSVVIGGFLAGCLFGGWLSILWGLAVIGLPGIALLICYLSGKTEKV